MNEEMVLKELVDDLIGDVTNYECSPEIEAYWEHKVQNMNSMWEFEKTMMMNLVFYGRMNVLYVDYFINLLKKKAFPEYHKLSNAIRTLQSNMLDEVEEGDEWEQYQSHGLPEVLSFRNLKIWYYNTKLETELLLKFLYGFCDPLNREKIASVLKISPERAAELLRAALIPYIEKVKGTFLQDLDDEFMIWLTR